MEERLRPTWQALSDVCSMLRLDMEGAVPIRVAANGVWRLPAHGAVAKVYRAGDDDLAERGLWAARWLAFKGIGAVVPYHQEMYRSRTGLPVTLWADLGDHRAAEPEELAAMLHQLQLIPVPDDLRRLSDPMASAHDKITEILWISEGERGRLHGGVERVREEWGCASKDVPLAVTHGDAWLGNIVVPADGRPRFLDLEGLCAAPAHFDAATLAAKTVTIGQYPAEVYRRFTGAYGTEVMDLEWWPAMQAVVELRSLLYALTTGIHHTGAREMARHRLECWLGNRGHRPWVWPALPVDYDGAAERSVPRPSVPSGA